MRTSIHQTSVIPLPQHFVLFLDVDGILHSTKVSDQLEGLVPCEQDACRVAFVKGELQPATFGMLNPEKQALLVAVLERYPQVRIVISSAWRLWQGYSVWDGSEPSDPAWERDHVDSLNWLKALLHPELANRIIGKTPQLFHASNGYFDLRATRLDEIRTYMGMHAQAEQLADCWIALDDQARHFVDLDAGVFHDLQGVHNHASAFPAEAVLLIDGEAGLTVASAVALDAALQRASVRLNPSACV